MQRLKQVAEQCICFFFGNFDENCNTNYGYSFVGKQANNQFRSLNSVHYLFQWWLEIVVTMLPLITGNALGIHNTNGTSLDRFG
jgi:hypothetical protein